MNDAEWAESCGWQVGSSSQGARDRIVLLRVESGPVPRNIDVHKSGVSWLARMASRRYHFTSPLPESAQFDLLDGGVVGRLVLAAPSWAVSADFLQASTIRMSNRTPREDEEVLVGSELALAVFLGWLVRSI